MPPFNTIIPSHDGKSFGAYMARAKNPDAPVLILIQEIFGVNAGMRQMCDTWASAGYNTFCPDIFWRQQVGVELTDKTPEEWGKAFEFFNGFDTELGVKDLQSTITFARSMAGVNGKVGSMGFCLGGKMAYLMATRSNANCNISYYGVGFGGLLNEVQNIKHPFLAHFAGEDKYLDKAALKPVQDAFAKNGNITSHVYEGVEHAFARINGVHFDNAAASLANQRSADFLAKHLR